MQILFDILKDSKAHYLDVHDDRRSPRRETAGIRCLRSATRPGRATGPQRVTGPGRLDDQSRPQATSTSNDPTKMFAFFNKPSFFSSPDDSPDLSPVSRTY